MLSPRYSGKFKKDIKKLEKQRKDFKKFKLLISLLLNEETLPDKFHDHPLKGEWKGFRDAHVEPDWILIYGIFGEELHLARTGSHSSIFKKYT